MNSAIRPAGCFQERSRSTSERRRAQALLIGPAGRSGERVGLARLNSTTEFTEDTEKRNGGFQLARSARVFLRVLRELCGEIDGRDARPTCPIEGPSSR